MRKRLSLSVCLLVIAVATPCFGWGADGHRIIGDIATAFLTEKTKAAIRELLGEQSLADVGNWADDIRNVPEFDWSKPLHYINVPRDATRIDLTRDCADGACVIAAVRKYEAALRDSSTPPDERIMALKFLVHFVGDVHQPLHVAYQDDRGGNSVRVIWLGEGDWNLHRVWDTGLIRRAIQGDREAWTQHMIKNITDRRVQQWKRSKDPLAWANESLNFTRRVYQQLPKGAHEPSTPLSLDDAYFKRNIDVVEQRLAAAGVRLAAMLNSIFDQPDSKVDDTTEPRTP